MAFAVTLSNLQPNEKDRQVKCQKWLVGDCGSRNVHLIFVYFTVCKLYFDVLKWEEKSNHSKAVLEIQAGYYKNAKIEMICEKYKAEVIKLRRLGYVINREMGNGTVIENT